MEPQQAEGVRAALERNGVECTLEARDATFGGSKMAERWKFIHKKNDAPLNSEAERWRKAMEEGMSCLLYTSWVPPITAIVCAAVALCGFVYYQFVL